MDASRDWGHSYDFVKAMHLMLQADTPGDYVCSTGISHTIRDLCEIAFGEVGLAWKDYVVVDEKYLRAEELHFLRGDSSKLRNELGWSPTYTFESMITEMVNFWLDGDKDA